MAFLNTRAPPHAICDATADVSVRRSLCPPICCGGGLCSEHATGASGHAVPHPDMACVSDYLGIQRRAISLGPMSSGISA
jgi:hypothetical protein